MRLVPLLALLLAGCHSTMHLGTPSGRVDSVPAGTSVSGGSVEVRSNSGPLLGAVIGLGVFAAIVQGDAPLRAVPAEMDPNRTVREVDCTQPVDLSTGGNLRCR